MREAPDPSIGQVKEKIIPNKHIKNLKMNHIQNITNCIMHKMFVIRHNYLV